jgi:DNA-binding XRE family transcriptional regulator
VTTIRDTPVDLTATLATLDQLPTLLRRRRRLLELSHAEVAATLGLNRATICTIEGGAGTTIRTARLILDWLVATEEAAS